MDATTLVIAAVCLLVGLAAGFLLTRTLSPQEGKRRLLEEQLKQKENELRAYQRDVSDHFLKSSEMLRELTRSHREISEHLASSAMLLSSPDVSRRVQDTAFAGLSSESRPRILSQVDAEPPKDYAPSVPGGVLSENYGLSDLQSDQVYTQGLATNKTNDDFDSENDDDPTLKVS